MSQLITRDIENRAYLRYMEDTRVSWLSGLDASWVSDGCGPAVVNININFRQEILFPAKLRISLSISQPSEKRILNQYVIADRDNPDDVFADAELTLVWIDKKTRRSIPVPAMIRKSLDQGA